MYEVFDLARPDIKAMKHYFRTLDEAEAHIGTCVRYDHDHPVESGGIQGAEYLGIRIVERAEQPCVSCGGEAENDAASYAQFPYCRSCYYTGAAFDHQYMNDLSLFRRSFPDADVSIEHTGGGCFWLAFRWEGDPYYYAATAGDAEVPEAGKWDSDWRYVGRYFYDPDDDETTDSHPDYEGTIILDGGWEGEEGARSFSKRQVIAAIKKDRAARDRMVA